MVENALVLLRRLLGLLPGLLEALLQHKLLVLEVLELLLKVLRCLGRLAFGLAMLRLEVLGRLLRGLELVAKF